MSTVQVEKKHPISFRLSTEAKRCLNELSRRLAIGRSGVVELAVRKLRDEHIPAKNGRKSR